MRGAVFGQPNRAGHSYITSTSLKPFTQRLFLTLLSNDVSVNYFILLFADSLILVSLPAALTCSLA